jgi:hypothetical protein
VCAIVIDVEAVDIHALDMRVDEARRDGPIANWLSADNYGQEIVNGAGGHSRPHRRGAYA